MNDCLGRQKARLPELTVQFTGLASTHIGKPRAACHLLAGRPLQVPFLAHCNGCAPGFIRGDRHILSTVLAQPKVFATVEFTLAKPCFWKRRCRRRHLVRHLEEEQPPSPEVAEHSIAGRICTLCEHESASAPRFSSPSHSTFAEVPACQQLTQVATTTTAKAAHNTAWLNSARAHNLICGKTSPLISAEADSGGCPVVQELTPVTL
jgi:hypothetical protein